VAKFEREIGQKVPDDIRWFLTNVVNGGWPGGEDFYVRMDAPDGLVDIHNIYGIDHPESHFDLLTTIRQSPGLLPHTWPIGHDTGGDLFIYMVDGPFKGQVRHLELDDDPDPEPCLVAKDIMEFARILDGPGENPEDYGWT